VKLLVATRSAHKLREIRALLRSVPFVDLLDLSQAGVQASDAEEGIEIYETFEENALAKARYFQGLTGLPTVADDSGLCVDALGGAPGVRSRRYSPLHQELSGELLDRANNHHLLQQLGPLDLAERTAHYVCSVALSIDDHSPPYIARGEVHGLILGLPKGRSGFGYDPLFYHPPSGLTLAELTPEQKDVISHRGEAFRSLTRHLQEREQPDGA